MPAVAYLRRSRVDTKRPGVVSHEIQLERIRATAKAAGDDPDQLTVIEDWGRSGRDEKLHLRTGMARLEAMVDAGEVTAIYCYNLSRLGRSVESVSRLAKRCAAAKVPIRCAEGESPDVSTSGGRLVLSILNAIHEWQADWTAERAAESSAVRRSRGDHMGPAPYGFRVIAGELVQRPSEDVQTVVDAYEATGTFQGTARRLTVSGVPSRKGGAWTASSVRQMIQRVAPEILPPATSRRRVTASFRLSGLLRCPHDGAMLTGRTFRGKWVSYSCRRAPQDPTHPHPRTISEDQVMPWVRAEAERLAVPADQVAGDVATAAQRDALEARRERVADAFLDGTIDKVRRDRELLAIGDELERLASVDRVMDIPAIDWTWTPATLNGVLRAVLDHVELGSDLWPIEATWRVPEWRAE